MSFYKSFFSIYVMLVLQNVVTLSVNLADNIMLGAYSETALAGVAAVNQIQFVFQQLMIGLGDGLVILCSQYWGRRQTDRIRKISVSALYTALAVALLLFVLTGLFPGQAVGLFTTDAAIIAEGRSYLQIVRYTYLFFAATQLMLAALRSTETIQIALRLSVMTFFINCGINYTLIFGRFGMPRMGAAGAAVGTLAARIAEFLVLVIYILVREQKLKFSPKDLLRMDGTLFADYAKLTAPMLLVQGLWGLNTALQTVILGHMAGNAIAANSASSTLFLVAKSAATGAASAASIMIGKTIGTGDIAAVKSYSVKLQRLFVVIGLVSGLFVYLVRIPLLELYSFQPETKQMANTFLVILSVVCVGMSYQMPTNTGIIRGGGNTMYTVKLDLISIWLIVLPVSFVMAFVVKASPVVVFCCLNADQIFKCVPAYLESHYGNWIRKLTRDG